MNHEKQDEWQISHFELSMYEPDDPDNPIIEIADLYDYLITRDKTNGHTVHKKISSDIRGSQFDSANIHYHSFDWHKDKKQFFPIFNSTSGNRADTSLRFLLTYMKKNGFYLFKFCDGNVLQGHLQQMGAKQDWIMTVLGVKDTITLANE